MSDKQARYLTTTLPYVNSDPHIGFALEIIEADVLARYWRLMGHEVFFSTGTDEHGQKIANKADEKGKDRQEYVNYFAGEFAKLKDALGLSYDNFIRTTDEDHKLAAQKMWNLCVANLDENGESDIYKKKYSGLYCVGCESFKNESDLVEGKCPDHNTAPELIEEENYFFRASRYRGYLVNEYLAKEGVIVPEWRRQEAITFASKFEDFSISREQERLNWGVPVPGDDSQVMYVWFDALTNYISTLGWPEDKKGNFAKFWNDGTTVQMAGKDQVRFQSIMWQAMLKSAGLAGTDQVFYHGFINSGGQKMSKSIGNVISPYEMIDRYGTEATRYILLRHIHPVDDSDVTWEKMDEWYTANLVNGLGNLVARVMKMAETHLEESVSRPEVSVFPEEYLQKLDSYDFLGAADFVWQKITALDEKIAETEPFKLVKTDKEAAVKIIQSLAIELYLIARLLNPLLPKTSSVVKEAVIKNQKPENLFSRLV